MEDTKQHYKPPLAIVWLKRDLRLRDHAALWHAQKNHQNVLLVYIAEPKVLEEAHFSKRHLNFIKQSLVDLNLQLEPFHSSVLTVKEECIPTFTILSGLFQIEGLYSHFETGIDVTFSSAIQVDFDVLLCSICGELFETFFE